MMMQTLNLNSFVEYVYRHHMRKPNNFLIKYEYKSDFFGVECNDGAKHGMRKRVVCECMFVTKNPIIVVASGN